MIIKKIESKKPICYNWMWPLHHHLIPKSVTERKELKFPHFPGGTVFYQQLMIFFFFSDTGSIEEWSLRKKETKEVRHIISPICCQKAIFKRQGRILMQEIEEDTNTKIFFLNGTEELILLKSPYYLKWSINQMWILLKHQWQFSQI